MSNDIELPDPWANFDAAYKKACETSDPKDYFRAALLAQQVRNALADREKRAQAAQPVAWLYKTHFGDVQAFVNEPPPRLKELCTPLYEHPPTEASKPVQATAPSDKQIAMAMLAVDDPLAWGKLGAEGGKAMIKQFVAALFATKQAEAIERCKCGYPMPCGKTVPVQFCKAEAPTASNAEDKEDDPTAEELDAFRRKHRMHWNAAENLLIEHLVQQLKCAAIAQVPEQVAGDSRLKEGAAKFLAFHPNGERREPDVFDARINHGVVYVCDIHDRECGDRPAGWCEDCPKRRAARTSGEAAK